MNNNQSGILSFVLVGGRSTGKTVYLSILCAKTASIKSNDDETQRYITKEWKILNEGNLPEATAATLIPLNFTYKNDEYNVEFSLDDCDGYFMETLNALDKPDDSNTSTSSERRRLKEKIQFSKGLLFLFPYEEEHNQESLDNFGAEIDTFITLVEKIYPDHKDLPIPVVIAVNKWDRSPHYKNEDEDIEAEKYLDTIPVYRAAKEKIKVYFKYVKIIPISAFGESENGTHPSNNLTTPYNITKPIDYFIEKTFINFERKLDKFEEKINSYSSEKFSSQDFQVSKYLSQDFPFNNDIKNLYEFQNIIYNDIKFQNSGEMIKRHVNTENKYKDLLVQLLHNKSSKEQNEIIDEHNVFYENVRNKSIRYNIDSILKETLKIESIERLKKLLISSTGVVILSYGLFIYYNWSLEKTTYKEIVEITENSKPVDTVEHASRYLSKYKADHIFLYPFTKIEDHRRKINEISSNAANEIDKNDRESLFRVAESYLNGEYSPDIPDTILKLNQLGDTKALKYAKDLQEVVHNHTQQEDFKQLVNEINTTRKVEDIKTIIIKSNIELKESQKEELKSLITEKINEQERKEINNIGKILTYQDFVDFKEQVSELSNKKLFKIQSIDYTYIRDENTAYKLESLIEKVNRYSDVLDNGVTATLSFWGSTNNLLELKCERDDELDITYDGELHRYQNGSCNISNGGYLMSWTNQTVKVREGTRNIRAKQIETIVSDIIKNFSVTITNKNLFDLYNNGNIKIPLESDQFRLQFKAIK